MILVLREDQETIQETSQVQFDYEQLYEALKYDREMFIQFFLGEQLYLPVPDFHRDIFDYLVTTVVEKFALAVPRGFSKTTLVKLAIIYYYVYTPIRFVVYCSNTTPIAKNECVDVINFIKSENFKLVFGEVTWIKENDSEGLYIFKLRIPDKTSETGYRLKTCILRALGAGQQIRGMNIDNMRPQLLICDDAEDDENTETELQRKKFKKWVYGALFKACARHSKKFWIGNLVGAHCLIKDFCESPYWHSVKYGCILADGKPLWPEMFSLDYLRKDFREYQRAGMTAKWFAEMMNMPMPDGMGLISAEEIKYVPARTPGDLQYGFITIDPAISRRASSDHSAITVHGLVDDKWQIVEHVREKLDPIQLLNLAVDLCYKWRLAVVGIESTAFQAVLISLFKFIQVQRMCFNIQVVELHASERKTERITAWASWLKTQNYVLTEGEFVITEQLLIYDPAKIENDDDVIDSCAYGPQMLTEHLGLIMLKALEMNPPAIRTLAEISTV